MTKPDDALRRFEATLGAISKMTTGEEQEGLRDARCPRCGSSDFVAASDLYTQAVVRQDEPAASSAQAHDAGLSDAQILAKFSPPRRKSAIGPALVAAIPLGAGAYYVYWRLGSILGQLAAMAAAVLTIVVFMTRLRRNSDDYFDRRRQWRKLYVCRKCAQVVTS